MNDSPQLKLIPGVLLALAGVLVDATFRSGVYQDRIWAQIALWLAVSLQDVSNDDSKSIITSVLIHGTFFCSLVSAGYQAFLVQCRWTTLNDSIQADYTRYLAPAMLLPLIYSWIYLTPLDNTSSSPWIQCVALYCLALISLCGWRWTKLRKKRVHQDLVGMPTVDESMPVFSTSTRSLEERVWTDWTPSEVLSWIHSLEGDGWSCVCSQLATEHIPGSSLDTLTVRELRSMGLGYGPAQLLVDKVSDLIQRNPTTTRRRADRYRDVEQDELEIDEWLKDNRAPSSPRLQQQQMGNNADERQEEATTSSLRLSTSPDILPGEFNEESIQKAKDLFRDQFGFELPELKLRPSNERANYSEDMPATTRTISGPAAVATSPAGHHQVENVFPEDLLDSMPPHVREVAEQRPDLVQMLWKQKQQGKSATSLALSKINREAAEMTGIATTSRGIDKVDSLEEDFCDANSDSERTGLLRKRATRTPTKYAAIR